MNYDQAVHIEHVSKSFGSIVAVDDLTFDVKPGEIFAMLGPNGAGKSTTIRMILDIIRPDEGSIRVMGQKITDDLKDRIGYLPEERGLYREAKVIDTMTYLGTLKGMSSSAARKRSMELLELLDLADKADSKVKEYSKGMQQKVQFAVTILHKPALIIVDEPFSGLDPVNTRLIKDMLVDLKNSGTAIIMSTHQMYQVEEMADRLLMINRGRQVLYGPVEVVRQEHAQHAIVVKGEGNWGSLDGVLRVEEDRNSRNGVMLFLDDGTQPNDILTQIAQSPDYTVERFEKALPSLNDIFIGVAGERLEDVESEHARREVANA
ncbi:MAG: ABC transporter ATP-binding protein [Chloroflexota bacterium]